MYESFYGLRERPFSLTSNPRFLLLTPGHSEALSALQYGIASRIGIIVLTGEAGTGKTTVVRAAVAAQSADCDLVVMTNPLVSRAEFFQHVAQGFGLAETVADSKTRFLTELSKTLEASVRKGRRTALIVDEAQALPYEILEEIRLLANMETDEEKLLPVVLAGQPELGERLARPELRQLKQRVAVRCSLGRLRPTETADYIAGRIRVAGGDGAKLFTPAAVGLIQRCAEGVPRTINVICDNALVTGFAADRRPVDVDIVVEVCRDLDIDVPHPAVGPSLVAAQAPAESSEAIAQPVARAGPSRRFFSF